MKLQGIVQSASGEQRSITVSPKDSSNEPTELTLKISVALEDEKRNKTIPVKKQTKKPFFESKYDRYERTYTNLLAESDVLIEDLIVENRLLTETINYIFHNKLISNEQIEEIKKLTGERGIRQLVDGSYYW